MNKTLVITVLAKDRPGIVHTLSETFVTFEANWDKSHLAQIADKFAGLIQITVAQAQYEGLKSALQKLHDADNQLQILLDEADDVKTPKEHFTIEVLGADRPGIIDDITGAISSLKVNISGLETEQREASMSSEILFYAKLDLGIPQGVSIEDVQDTLEALQDQLMVDLNFGD